MIELAGWLGAAFFAFCGLPQAILCYKQGHAEGVSELFLWMWFIGEVLTFYYVLETSAGLPLLANYVFNFMILLFVMRYKYMPRAYETY